MKSLFLAAAAIIAVPVSAQMQPAAPADQTAPAATPDTATTTPPADPAATPAADPAATTADPAATAADPAMQAPPAPTGTDTMSTTGSTGMNNGMASTAPMGDPNAADPAGGYQPSAPPIQGTPAPGATVRFQPAADPNTAYPPPAPMKSYPICKKGQYDNCMQRGGK